MKSILFMLDCAHYEYEFKQCSNSLKKLAYEHLTGEKLATDCRVYSKLYDSCLKKSVNENIDLQKYEANLFESRLRSVQENNVWTYRNSPPPNWNTELPDWCIEHLKTTSWFKKQSNNNR